MRTMEAELSAEPEVEQCQYTSRQYAFASGAGRNLTSNRQNSMTEFVMDVFFYPYEISMWYDGA